jgi:predicted DNA-binding transcriptional regulator AlpA
MIVLMATRENAQINADAESTPEPLWDVHDVSRFFKSSRSWVYHRAEGGELPCIRIGGLLRFDPQAIRALVRTEKPSAGRMVKSKR